MQFQRKQGFYEKYAKRCLDIGCSFLAILFFGWLYLLIAVAVRVKMGKPVLFTQPRPGLIGKDGKEKIFNMYKFRTMTDKRNENGELLPDEQRLTNFGRMLRVTSLDELPEVFNILKGDMSIIGPRPLLVRYLPYYTKNERQRHRVRPGLTGLSQVNGRNNLSWEERFKWDVEYVNNITFRKDLSIIFKTITKVLTHTDIVMGSEMIMEDLDAERANMEDKAIE